MDTPMNSISNQDENLIQSEQNIQQNENVNQNFVEKSDQSPEQSNTFVIRFIISNIIVYLLSLIVLIGCIILVIKNPQFDIYIRIAILLFGIIFPLILFIFCVYKIILIKNTSNRKVLIKVINYLCCSKMKLNLDIENIHFYIRREIHQNDDGSHVSFRLFIINDYQNLVGLDLDASNIRQKPAKFFYSFDNVWKGRYNCIEYAQVLNHFIGSSGNYDNPLFFNINKYLNKNQAIFFFSPDLSKYMKFSDHFFIYHLRNPLGNPSWIDLTFFIITCFINFISIIVVVNLLYSKIDVIIKILAVIAFPIVNIILYFLYKMFKSCLDNICRIDCIYSKYFDRIFIGFVKYNEKKYVNTFEYQMNNISKFFIEREGNSNSKFNLKVEFKNNTIEQVCTIKNKTQEELEGLAYLLNERLNLNSINNSSEQIYSWNLFFNYY